MRYEALDKQSYVRNTWDVMTNILQKPVLHIAYYTMIQRRVLDPATSDMPFPFLRCDIPVVCLLQCHFLYGSIFAVCCVTGAMVRQLPKSNGKGRRSTMARRILINTMKNARILINLAHLLAKGGMRLQ